MNLGRGWIWYAAGLLLALIAGVLAVLALRQAAPAAQPARASRPVIVARRDIPARQNITLEALEARDVPLENIPSGAIYRVEDALGKTILQDVKAGAPLLAQYLTSQGIGLAVTTTASLALQLPPDKVAVVLPAGDLLSASGDVNVGDRIDLLASMVVASQKAGEGGQVTLMNLQNVPIIKVLYESTSGGALVQTQQRRVTGLVLAVEPQDGIILKYFADSGAKLSIDLRASRLTMSFDVTPVTLEYLADKYKIAPPKQLEAR